MEKGRVIIYRRLLFLSLLSLFFMIHWGGTNAHAEPIRGVTDTVIKIGLICDLTGPIAGDIGLPANETISIYTRQINETGGIFGRKVKLFVEDDRYSIPAAIAAFKKLIFKDQIFALVGPVSVGGNKALFRQIDKHGVPNISVAPDEAMVRPLRKYTFMPFNLYDDQLGVIFDYILRDLKPPEIKITFVYFDAESGKVGLASVKKWCDFFDIPLNTEMINMGALDATSQVMSIKRKKPTHILIHHGAPGTALLLRDLQKFGMNTPVYGTTIALTEDTVRMAGSASRNCIGSLPFSPWYGDMEGPRKMREIILKYKPGTEKPYRSMVYTAGWVGAMTLYEGIRRAGQDLTVESLLAGLESFKDFDTKDLCGPVNFSPKNHQGLYHSKLYKADPDNGILVPITDWRKAPATQ